MLFLSYVQRKPSDKSNQRHLKMSQLHADEGVHLLLGCRLK